MKEIKILKELEKDFPLNERPYQLIAKRVGVDEKRIIKIVKKYKKQGLIKKISASLAYQRLGIKANAMVVWIIPQGKVKRVGKIMASFSQVSHCYERPTSSYWPYNLFTMIHAKTKKECEKVAEKISQVTGAHQYKLIYSTQELKKKRMRYF